MARVLFKYGNYAAYSASTKDENVIYFISDKQQIYKGSTLYADVTSNTVKFATEVPTVETASDGVLYVVTTAEGVGIYTKSGSTIEQIGGGTVKEGAIADIGAFDDAVLVKTGTVLTEGDDTKIPTAGAVKDAIATAIADYDGAFVDVSASRASDNSGTVLTFTPKEGAAKEITIADLFLTSASYDSDTHILSFTVRGSDTPVTVDLTDLVPQAVNASQVALARSITATVDVGNVKKGDKIELATVTDVQKLFEKILSQDSNPTTTQPSVSVTLTGAGAKEVGTSFTPTYTVTLNPGAYSNNAEGAQPTGVTATSYSVTDTNSNSASTSSGSFTAFTVQDNTNYKVSATVEYGDGNIPTTFLGESYPAGQIKAGSKSGSSSSVTGYRNCYWGYKTADNLIADPTTITSAQIKALGNTNRNKPSSLAATNMQQMFFAVPASQASTLSIVGTNSPLPQTVEGPITVQIGGVNDYSPIAYNVFYVNNAAPASGSETYKLTWKA